MTAEQILGLGTGVLFGFLLQKGRVLRFEKQIGALLFRDMTIIKFMLSAIIVGMVGIYLMNDLGIIELKHKTMSVGAVVLGGALFGCGWAVAGFCPGTAVGALGEGRLHALWVILGMIAGAALYAEIYPGLSGVLGWHDWGKIGLEDLTHVNHWILIVILAALYIALFAWFEKKKI